MQSTEEASETASTTEINRVISVKMIEKQQSM
ncbi:hypothetical protein HNP81_003237 [Peribacillus huizhouensis]|uniref:Uncharacterized protein n=1 Tax=Peribacillus huizhouensis TaxID=1501239 RepID=A0ABR6CTM4_9BACI|nr:hypothetical protein [Peribacillus huizhouensis]